jgi:hypothetical protein
VDRRDQEINFQEADRRYSELLRQHAAGSISDEEFDAQSEQLMVQDQDDRWWAKLGELGEWHYYNGSTWVRGTPPDYEEVAHGPLADSSPAQTPVTHGPLADSSPTQTPSSPYSEGIKNREDGRRRGISPWVLVVGFGGIALVGIVLVVWVLVPFLQSEQAPSKQGGAISSKGGEPAPNGAAFDAAFVHRATPENISANSTYLDNPLTNGNPNVIVYVTQNWNPGGGTGTYNDHPVGVWYDSGASKWAIFNQDRQAMPNGAAFNVGVLKEATEAR